MQVAAEPNKALRRALTVEALKQLSDTLNGQDLSYTAKLFIRECLHQEPHKRPSAGQLLRDFRKRNKAVPPRK